MFDASHDKQQVLAGSTTLPITLCRLAYHGWSGQVRIGTHWIVEIDAHRIRALTLPDDDLSLGRLLVAQGLVRTETIEAAATSARKQDRLQGQILVSWGLPQHRLWDALFEQASRRFASILDRASGLVSLKPTQHLAIRQTLGVPLDLREAIPNWVIQPVGHSKLHHWMHVHEPVRFAAIGPLATWLAADRPGLVDLIGAINDGCPLAEVLARQPNDEALRFVFTLFRLGLIQKQQARARHEQAGPEPPGPRPQGPSSRSKDQRPGKNTDRASNHLDEQPPHDPKALRLWWHRMARRYHPDLNGIGDDTLKRFMEIHRLYRVTLRNSE